ncbi:MAG: Fic/DOC family N-terminal domain-containing protein [bacterium]
MTDNYTPKLLPIENLKWESFVHLIGKANAEIARFDGLLQSMPNPAVLLSPLTTQEAVLSSKIEGTRASLQEVLEYEADPQKENKKYEDIKEIINYRKALQSAVKEIEKFSLSNRVIKNAHKILLHGVRGENKDRGNFRKQQVFIGKLGTTIQQASYVPPSADKINALMTNLEKYIHSDEKDILVQLAIVHAQFEIIHPFFDGNGRVGRILMPIFLYFKKVLSSPMFYLSAYFESHREEYYGQLLRVSQKNNWEGWIEYFLNAVTIQAKENINKAKAIHQLYDTKKLIIAELTRSQFSIKALDFLFCNPIFNSPQFVKDSNIPKASAARILKALTKGGVIRIIQKGIGSRPTTYIFTKLLSIVM